MIDQERKTTAVASIVISPIRMSRDAPSSPNDLRLSSNTNNNMNSMTPLGYQTSDIQFSSPPTQRGPRKDQYNHRQNYQYHHHHDRRRDPFGESSDDDNDENINDGKHISLTSFRSMPLVNLEGEESNREDHKLVFVDEIDAPSDERDDTIYEMINCHQNPQQHQHQQQSQEISDQGNQEEFENNEEEQEETVEERRRREDEESEALARQLMAEEAMASYAQSSDFLRSHANEYSEEDLNALEALMAEEDPMIDEAEDVGEDGSEEFSYETLLRLGERMGDVKSERWAMKAQQEIAKLKTVKYNCSMAIGKDENDCCVKCLICQFQYEEGETLLELPCKHRFHSDCINQWLSTKDHCPYCRQSIIE